MKNSDGKAGIVIVILIAIILVALVPWYFIISRNLGSEPIRDTEAISTEPSDEEELEPTDEPDEPDEPDDDQTPEETPPPHDVQLPEHEIPLDETVQSIEILNPELFMELSAIASRYNSIAISLTAFDGESGEFFTFEYGYADVSEERIVDTNTKFRVASLSKLVTAICAMVLVDEGALDLDADISGYLGYEVINTHHPGTAITARMLMQHTSSIFDSSAFQMSRDRGSTESVRQLLERGSSFRRNQPGEHFEYSNFGFSVLAAVCEVITDKSLDTLARDLLFDPLGIDAGYIPLNMHDTENIAVIYNDRHEITSSVQSQLNVEESRTLGHDVHLAQGNLTISAIDYARILAMLSNGGILRNVRILSSNAVYEMHKHDVDGVTYQQGLATRYSFGGFIPAEGFFWHTGSAYGTFSQYLYNTERNTNRGIVVVTTGATTGREQNGMITLCTELSVAAWRGLGFTIVDYELDVNEQVDEEE